MNEHRRIKFGGGGKDHDQLVMTNGIAHVIEQNSNAQPTTGQPVAQQLPNTFYLLGGCRLLPGRAAHGDSGFAMEEIGLIFALNHFNTRGVMAHRSAKINEGCGLNQTAKGRHWKGACLGVQLCGNAV